MATTNNHHQGYDSWEEYYREKGKEKSGPIQDLVQTDLSFLDNLPREHAGKPTTFKEHLIQYPDGNFIIVPVRGQTK
jgi:hypothetical protein